MTAAQLVTRLVEGDPRALGRAITLVEDRHPAADEVLAHAFARSGRGAVVGFTGPPGAGKSTLVGALVQVLRAQEQSVAVLSIDPSSPFSHGAVLGDRIRMGAHFTDPGVFIRSMASRGALGGLSEATFRAIALMDAAGYDHVLVETVGVGQTEIEVVNHTDTVVLLLQPGSGDTIQAIKAGIMEIPDVVVVNKADHPAAAKTMKELRAALRASNAGRAWPTPAVATEALTGKGVDDLADALARHREHLAESGELDERRRRALHAGVRELAIARLREALDLRIAGDPDYAQQLEALAARRADPAAVAASLVERMAPGSPA